MPSHGGSYFVGRAEELDLLGAVYDEVLGGRMLTVLLAGDAGIGKSRLVEEFCDRVLLQGAIVASGMCVPGEAALPYAPVVGILRDLSRQDGDRATGDLLRALCAPPQVDDTTPQHAAESSRMFARTMLFESILQLVLDIAHEAPFVLVVEDLQWCDAASAQLLDYLVRNLGDARVLVVGTYRTEDFDAAHPLSTWLAELARSRRTRNVTLAGLGRVELTALLAETTGSSDPVMLEKVWTRSQGNPFFAEELVAAGVDGALPTALKGITLARVRTVSTACRDVLCIVAAAGAAADHELLRVVCAEPHQLADVLAEALDRRILLVDSDGITYSFRHGLLREAVYDDLLPARRRDLHRAIAVALQEHPHAGPSNPVHRSAALAAHWWSAGDFAAALLPSIAAADAAAGVLAFREAYAHLEHALTAAERVDELPAGITCLALLERAAEYVYYTSGAVRAAEIAQAAVAEALAAGDAVATARCYTRLGRSLWGTGDAAAAFAAFHAAAEALPDDEPVRERAYVLAEEARGLMMLGQTSAAEKLAHDAIAAAEAAGARDLVGHAINTLGCCIANSGYFDEGIDLIRESIVIAEELNSPEDLNRGYANLSALLVDAGRIEEAAAVALDAAAMGEEVGGIRLNTAASNSIFALMMLGRWREAEDMLEHLGMAPYGACVASPYIDRLPFAMHRGRYDDADNLLRTAHELTDGLHDSQFATSVNLLDAQLAVERGRPDDALAPLQVALRAVHTTEDGYRHICQIAAYTARAAADAGIAARSGASSVAVELLSLADETIAMAVQTTADSAAAGLAQPCQGTAFLAQAHAERTRLDRSDPAAWQAAADAFAAIPDVYWTAYCQWRAAEALLESRGSRAQAIELLTAAYATGRRLDVPAFVRRIQDLAVRSRIELTEAAPTPADQQAENAAQLGLTAREAEVLGQLAAGRSDREIAEALFISKKTVGVHVSNVLRKLQVSNRVEAGRVGQAHGLQPAQR